MRGCLVFGVCHVLSCLLCLIHVLIFFFFFFFLRQTTLCMVCLKSPCVFIQGRVGVFFGVGWVFCCFEKKSGFAVMFKFMYSFMMH